MYKIALVAAALLVCTPAMAQDGCLQSGGGPYTLTGNLAAGRFRDAAGRPETALILTLAKPVCMTGAQDEDKVKATTRVHVFSSDEALHRRLQGMAGRSVTVAGEPFGEHTAHHHAPIVLNVSKIGP